MTKQAEVVAIFEQANASVRANRKGKDPKESLVDFDHFISNGKGRENIWHSHVMWL